MPAQNSSRRRLLKALAGAGGVFTAGKLLPERWSTPMVDSVLLPVHAQTSGPFFDVVPVPEVVGSAGKRRGILDLIVPRAHAQTAEEAHICATPNGDLAFLDVVFISAFTSTPGTGIHFAGLVPIGGATTGLNFVAIADGCKQKTLVIQAQLNVLAQGSLIVNDDLVIPFNLPAAPCNLPDLGECLFEGP